jgi:lipopolysaccharide transport system ATP-binding protein
VSDIAVRTERLGKAYKLGIERGGYGTLRESIVDASRRSLQRIAGQRPPKLPEDTLWALRDLSLTVVRGEVVGLIGHNGAGKTTLLKILSRITEPTSGWADVTGRVGSLLEVGTGFHTELTGRENIYLNGAILGMRRAEVRRRFDEVVAFAEMERFLDTPIKRYSSGMTVRLAFAVAAHLETEILLVDEVLAVGDAAFQRKSLGKMNEVAREGRTVLFVSHNLSMVRALCTRGVVLERGNVVADAPVSEAIDSYLRTLERPSAGDLLQRTDRDRRSQRQSLVRRIEVRDASGHAGAVVGGRPVTIVVHVTEVLPAMDCRLTIVNALGQPVATFDSAVFAPTDVRDQSAGPQLECEIDALPLVPGRYQIDVRLRAGGKTQDRLRAAVFFDVEPGVMGDRPMPTASTKKGDVVIPHVWRLPG